MKPKKKDKYILEYNPDNLSKIFKLITKKIPESIFSILDNNFFKYIISEKIIDLYAIKKNSKPKFCFL